MVTGTPAHLRRRPKLVRGYAELHAHSIYSLLDGVPAPEALLARAADLGIPALALTDHDALYGAVRFVRAAQEAGIKPILGAEMTLGDGSHLTLLVETAEGYANLCRLITLARRDQEKGLARLDRRDLAAHTGGLIALSGCRRGEIPALLLAGMAEQALGVAQGYSRVFGPDRFFIELQRHYLKGDNRLLARLAALADRVDLDVVATGDVHYLHPRQREVHDVLSCIGHHTTLEDADDLLGLNDEYVLRPPGEMAELFGDIPIAVENALRIAERCASADAYLPAGTQILPGAPLDAGHAPSSHLRWLCEQALRRRYPVDPPRDLLERELLIIQQMGLANYFLIVWDIVRFAREAGIRCQGRGSAANSLVAYLLDISPIDPIACDLVFERFLSPERGSPPDIDVDIAADRREEVIQYIYRRYGGEHAAMACTFVTFRARSAVRDVARALGFPPALVERLAGALDVRDANSVKESRGMLETFDAEQLAGKPFQHLLRLVPQLDGIPRHLGIHNGGMVIAGPPLCELVPLEPATMEGRVVTQWDKDGLEGAGMVKIDLLGLRMLSAIEDAVTIIAGQTERSLSCGTGDRPIGEQPDLAALSLDDLEVYDMLCRGETIGVFQVESRAQASLIPRFQPRSFEDLVIQISLIRPGPLQAQMVRPYLRRREGRELVSYPHPLLENALKETLGVIIFQEQVLKVARDMAGFTPGEAELLRRALSHKRAGREIARFKERFLEGATGQGVDEETAQAAFKQLQAFGGYSFPKSHAAAFAVLTYQSAWLRHYHPAAFFAALLRHQPMGFYPAHVIVSEARRCGVEVRPVDVEASDLRATVEGEALRLGLAVVNGLGEMGGQSVVEARRFGPFRSLADFCRRTKLGRRAVEAMIWAGAFDGWGVPRRQLLWELKMALEAAEGPPELPLPPPEGRPRFAFLSPRGRLWTEAAHTGMSAREHLTSLVGDKLRAMGVTPSGKLPELKDGQKVWVGGVIVSRQRPPTAKGVAFLALEDEGGLINVVVRPKVYEESRQALRSPFVVVGGQLQRRGEAISVLAWKVVPLEVELE
ncbi:MAG: DNA polymerase III subunit alpha [Anaerolineae bacterium]|jgi:error-prone DNA polymerase